MKKFTPMILFLVLLLVAVAVPTSRYWLFNNVGRWHIVLLHFPIGLLALGWLMEVAHRKQVAGITAEAVRFVLGVGFLGALAATISGLILHNQGSYDLELVEWHERLGIGTAVFALITFLLHHTKKRTLYFVCLTLTVILLAAAGHFGGSLTHGVDFLDENLGNTNSPQANLLQQTPFDEAVVWEDVIEPIVTEKCASCHNNSKRKGGLVLLDSASIFAGGDNGSVLTADKQTSICNVLHMPLEDDLHMPPSGKAQLTKDEMELLCWWMESKSPFSSRLADMALEPQMDVLLRERLAPPDPIDLLGIEKPNPSLVASLQAEGIRVLQPNLETPWLSVNFSDHPDLQEKDWESLDDLQANITHLDLGNATVNSDLLDWVADCQQLKSLKLDQCTLEASDLDQLSALEHLEQLNLYGAQIDGDATDVISKFTQLKRLYLWRSSITQGQITALRTSMPEVDVRGEDLSELFPMQQMVAPRLTSESPFLQTGIPFPVKSPYPEVEIRYTLDGSEPTETSPLLDDETVFDQTCRFRARAYKEGWKPSNELETSLVQLWPQPISVSKQKGPDPKYPGAEGKNLVDGKIGEASISDAQWQGYWGENCWMMLDLGEEKAVHGVAVHALEDTKSWVFYPKSVHVEWGDNPRQLSEKNTLDFNRTQQVTNIRTDVFQVPINASARYVKVSITSYGKLPEWHAAPGQPSWLFVDEVTVY